MVRRRCFALLLVGLTYRLASDFVVPGGAAGRLSATRTIRTAQTDRLGVNPGRGSSATAVRAFDGAAWESSSSSSALDLPIGMAETVVGLAALYAIMSMAEYVYHRYFQHLGLNKVGAVRTVRKTFKLNTFQGDGHVEHHRETLDDMTLDVEPGRELVLDIDPFRGEVCQLLLDLDPAQAVVTNIDQLSPLHEAAFLGRAQLLDMLLRFSVNQHWNRYGRAVRLPSGPNMRAGRRLLSPLHLACRQGHLATCAVLLKASADPQLVCSQGRTALHHACAGASRPRDLRAGNILELCHLLLRQQPALLSLRDTFGQTPLDLVQQSFAPPELRLLLRKAAPVAVHQDTFTKTLDGHGGHRRRQKLSKEPG